MRRVALAGIAVMAVAGCTSTETGDPSPSGGGAGVSSTAPTGGSSAGTSTAPVGGAPAVTNPKDARNAAPCGLLTGAQLGQLGLSTTSREQRLPAPFATGCLWASTDNSWGVAYGFDTTRAGLNEIYQRKSVYQHFEPRSIDGYPAVDAQTVYNPQDCYTYVGIADSQLLYVNVDNRPSSGQAAAPACERLDQVVKMIIGNLPPLK